MLLSSRSFYVKASIRKTSHSLGCGLSYTFRYRQIMWSRREHQFCQIRDHHSDSLHPCLPQSCAAPFPSTGRPFASLDSTQRRCRNIERWNCTSSPCLPRIESLRTDCLLSRTSAYPRESSRHCLLLSC